MKYGKFFSAILFAGLLKVNAQDCDIVKGILKNYYQINEAEDCCKYANNDQYVVSCNGASVTSLSIINAQNLVQVPDAISSLTNLENLDFSNCQIAQFPYHLKSLPKLKSLSLWKNNISELTDEIAQFITLEQLDLGNNGLTAIPASISQMPALNNLNLSNNHIQALPDTLYQLKIKKLNVSGNQDLGGTLKSFSETPDFCNIKNTHLCIDKKGVCADYLVNNNRMPYCNPNDFTEDELNVDKSGDDTLGEKVSKKVSATTIVIIILVVLLIVLGVIGALIYKNRSKKNPQPAPLRSEDSLEVVVDQNKNNKKEVAEVKENVKQENTEVKENVNKAANETTSTANNDYNKDRSVSNINEPDSTAEIKPLVNNQK